MHYLKAGDWASALLVITVWIQVLTAYRGLPVRIPTHFDVHGAADSHGPKTVLWLMPVLSLLMALVLSLPAMARTPVGVERYLGLIRLETLALMAVVTHGWIRVALSRSERLSKLVWVVTAVLLATALVGRRLIQP